MYGKLMSDELDKSQRGKHEAPGCKEAETQWSTYDSSIVTV
jgi:hypothetical protein